MAEHRDQNHSAAQDLGKAQGRPEKASTRIGTHTGLQHMITDARAAEIILLAANCRTKPRQVEIRILMLGGTI
ncbi:hypothetical protein [Ensifer adhaerens]|uniref:hypothetical protein n=1 Tax=Ensifer adhaerens TaxID=106592 RepID=UPI00117873D6|nr:hypothetical protein [Ensifer adhaerens]